MKSAWFERNERPWRLPWPIWDGGVFWVVPLLFWKLIIRPSSRAAQLFIGGWLYLFLVLAYLAIVARLLRWLHLV